MHRIAVVSGLALTFGISNARADGSASDAGAGVRVDVGGPSALVRRNRLNVANK